MKKPSKSIFAHVVPRCLRIALVIPVCTAVVDLAAGVGRVEYATADLAKRTATVAWTWADLTDNAVRLSLTRNGDDFPAAGWGGTLFIGDGALGCAVAGTPSGYNELLFDIGRDNVPTNGKYAVQILATNGTGRVEEWVRGTLTVRANPAAEGMPTNWTAYADIARKVAPYIDAEGILRNPANADALWAVVSGRAGELVTNCVDNASAATLQSAKAYADDAIQAAGSVTPEIVTNIVLDVAPAPDFTTGNAQLVATIAATAPAPDLSTNNAVLVETIEATAPAPGDYSAVSNAAIYAAITNALQDTAIAGKASKSDATLTPIYSQTPTFSEWTYSGIPDGWVVEIPPRIETDPDILRYYNWSMSLWDGELSRYLYSTSAVDSNEVVFDIPEGGTVTATRTRTDIIGYRLGPDASGNPNRDKPIAALDAVPPTVTNIVRDLSLGGIWDEALQVWWTPRMRSGSLTYEATTNVNLNAEN